MRGAFGKPQGTVARVNIGQIILSVRTKDNHKASAIEAFRRAKFKFPGRQKVSINLYCHQIAPSITVTIKLYRSLCPRSGASLSGLGNNMRRCEKMVG